MMNKIFVFGTLKEGFPNFDSNKGLRISGSFITKERYPLYLVGDHYSPWLVNQPGEGSQVVGQVFLVSKSALDEMDKLERITERDGYRRMKIDVIHQDSHEVLKVFVYMKEKNQLEKKEIKAGPLPCYELEHAELYRGRST